MIIKVQQSTFNSDNVPQMMAYNENRSLMFQGDLTPEIEQLLNGELKRFYYAEVDEDGAFEISHEAPDQDW